MLLLMVLMPFVDTPVYRGQGSSSHKWSRTDVRAREHNAMAACLGLGQGAACLGLGQGGCMPRVRPGGCMLRARPGGLHV